MRKPEQTEVKEMDRNSSEYVCKFFMLNISKITITYVSKLK